MITHDHIYGMMSEIATEKERWLAFWFERILPPVCVRWVKERKNLKAVSNYMERKRIRLVVRVGDTRTTLMRGEEIIASFEVKTTRR